MRWVCAATVCVAGCFTKPPAPMAVDDGGVDSAPVVVTGGMRRVITVTLPPSVPLERFPVFVNIKADNDLQSAGGADRIAFTTMNGDLLACDIVAYGQGGDLEAWVTLPTLSPTMREFVLVYGEDLSVRNACSPAAAWSDYAAVWHFSDVDLSLIRDSSPNALNLDLTHGLPVRTGGAAGSGALFDNTDANGPDQMCVPDAPALQFALRSFSYEAWVNPIGYVDTYDVALYKGAKNAGFAGFDLELGVGDWTAWIRDDSTGTGARVNNASFTGDPSNLQGKWNHLVVAVDRDANILRTYLNGMPTETDGPLEVLSVNGPEPLCVGDFNQPSHAVFDEFRIREGVPSLQWVLASHRNVTMSAFLSVSGPMN